MKLEKAIQRIIDRITLSDDDTSTEIYWYMYQYKAIRDLPEDQFEAVYDEISDACGFQKGVTNGYITQDRSERKQAL